MAIPVGLMAAGTVMQMLSQYGANMAQAKAEKANADFYNMQAELARSGMLRQQRLASFDYTYKLGEQSGNYASSGVDSSGSAAITMGGTLANYIEEIQAIRQKGEVDIKLARARSRQAADTAATLSSPAYNLTQAATTGISAYVQSEGFGSWNDDRGVEYKFMEGGPGSGTKTTGYGAGKPGTFLKDTYSASDMGTFQSHYLGTIGGK